MTRTISEVPDVTLFSFLSGEGEAPHLLSGADLGISYELEGILNQLSLP